MHVYLVETKVPLSSRVLFKGARSTGDVLRKYAHSLISGTACACMPLEASHIAVVQGGVERD